MSLQLFINSVSETDSEKFMMRKTQKDLLRYLTISNEDEKWVSIMVRPMKADK